MNNNNFICAVQEPAARKELTLTKSAFFGDTGPGGETLEQVYGLGRFEKLGCLSSMSHDATFINTGRGRTVNPEELAFVFSTRSDLTALLDVTDPEEPLPRRSPLWALPNIHITNHIAGSKRNEVGRMADMAIEEFERWSRGVPLRYSVEFETLQKMA